MSASPKIEWTGATWNPVRGCTKTATGCGHCYAATFAEPLRGFLAAGLLLEPIRQAVVFFAALPAPWVKTISST
jgi:hypothetical protein